MSKDVNTIHDELLGNVSDTYQKSEGFPVWDLLRAFAFGLRKLWIKVYDIEAKQNVDNLTGTELERFVSQRKGLTRKEATYAVGYVTVTGEGTIYIGDIFSSKGGVEFAATEEKTINGSDTVAVICLTAGAIGNVPAMSVCEMPVTVQGIATVCNDEPMVDGYEAETDDSLRDRYYDELRKPATSGNVYHYERWAREIAGVGDVKVFPLWQGDNTVQVIVIDDQRLVPSQELIDRVQEHIDPNEAGTGLGQAPIGAYCTVSPADALLVNVSVNLILQEIAELEVVKADIETKVTDYLKEIAFLNNYVSVAKVGDLILQVKGVEDYDTLIINGSATRVAIPDKSVAVFGQVVINVI